MHISNAALVRQIFEQCTGFSLCNSLPCSGLDQGIVRAGSHTDYDCLVSIYKSFLTKTHLETWARARHFCFNGMGKSKSQIKAGYTFLDFDSGLEVCPGREAHTSFAQGDKWTKIKAETGPIVCNIGDMLSKLL